MTLFHSKNVKFQEKLRTHKPQPPFHRAVGKFGRWIRVSANERLYDVSLFSAMCTPKRSVGPV